MLVTGRVMLHYVVYVVTIITRLYHVPLLNSDFLWNLTRDLSRFVKIQCSLFLLRAYSFGIESTLY